MDTEQLKAFLVVAQTSSFSAAADRLHLTQPAISKRIAALESELNTPLFDRVGRRVQMTSAGHLLQPRAESVLADLAAARQSITDLAGQVRGELRLATSHHIGLHKLPPILRQFSREHSPVNLQIAFLDSEVAHARVLEGSCELAVVTLAPQPQKFLISEPLWNDPLVFVTQRTDKVLRPVDLEELSHAPAILPDLGTYTGRLVKSLFDQRQLTLSLNMATNYLETIKMLVSVGLGWSVLPASMLDDHIMPLPVRNAGITRTLGMVYHRRRHLSNAATAFMTMLRAYPGRDASGLPGS